MTALLSSGAIIDLDGSVFVQLGIFFVMFFLLRVLVFKPVMAVLDARHDATLGAKEAAARLTADTGVQFARFEEELAKVRVEAGKEREAIRQDAMRLERELLASARTDADAIMDDGRATIAREATAARETLNKQTPILAQEIANRVLGRTVNS